MPTRRSNVLGSKSGCTSIRRPPGSTMASPQLRSCCVSDFLAANSTATNRPAEEAAGLFLFQRCSFRCRFSVPKLNRRLRQNSLRRIPLLTNSATNSLTSARVRRLCDETFCSTLIRKLQHKPFPWNRCVAQTLTVKVQPAILCQLLDGYVCAARLRSHCTFSGGLWV